MKKFNKISIIGAGFMGASLALDIKSNEMANEICALARNESRAKEISDLAIFDTVSHDLELVLNGADLVIIATPVKTIGQYLAKVCDYCKNNNPECIVTDIGSTTGEIFSRAKAMVEAGETWLATNFVSSHPICGAETTGASSAYKDLYKESPCIITPINECEATGVLKKFWENVGSRVSILSAQEHDAYLAYTSHLPHVLSYVYSTGVKTDFLPYTAGSFRDMTRITKAGTEVWQDILLSNRDEILKAIQMFKSNLDDLETYIERKDIAGINEYLNTAKSKVTPKEGL